MNGAPPSGGVSSNTCKKKWSAYTSATMSGFDWKKYHAYRVFDEFIQHFLIDRKSYVTTHRQVLDLPMAIEEIRTRFVADFDDSEASFEDKVAIQFLNTSENTKLVFTNIEYLWAMPVGKILPPTKAKYAKRWFPEHVLPRNLDNYFFIHPHTIANPGPWYPRNKYWELVAIFRIVKIVTEEEALKTVEGIKKRIEQLCYDAIYSGVPEGGSFPVKHVCGAHSIFLHLADPEKYESIISIENKKQILGVFSPILEGEEIPECNEAKLKRIRAKLYSTTAPVDLDDWKYRWFFYTDEIQPAWIDKKTKKSQRAGYVRYQISEEENAVDLEGGKTKYSGYRLQRSRTLVAAVKKRDKFTCLSCQFNLGTEIVHVHHLDPLSERKKPAETSAADLITLCPTCHYLAHYFLRKSPMNKQKNVLLESLGTVRCWPKNVRMRAAD